jgi:cysteine desulfurase
MDTIYLDHSATTPIDPEVLAAMMPFFAFSFGNPSSIHNLGNLAKEAITEARCRTADLIGAEPTEIIFTAGGTEADNLALLGLAAMQTGKNHIITSAIEHPAILDTCSHLECLGFRITYIPVDTRGCIDPDDVFRVMDEKTFLVSIMHANNEIGTMAPLEEIGAVVRDKGICMHTDAVQTAGKMPVNVDELHVDMLSLSGHKFYGPKGIGALYIRKGTMIAPLSYGGHQERDLRAGTENVPGIVALGKTCQIASRDLDFQTLHLKQLRDGLESLIVDGIPDAHINGHPFQRTPHILSVSFPGMEGATIVREMSKRNVFLSAGAACTSGSAGISHVLKALGMPTELAKGTVRFSLGKTNQENEIIGAVERLKEVVARLRLTSRGY